MGGKKKLNKRSSLPYKWSKLVIMTEKQSEKSERGKKKKKNRALMYYL